jgi:hypothetical protein
VADATMVLTFRVRWKPLMLALCVLRMPRLAARLCLVVEKPRG